MNICGKDVGKAGIATPVRQAQFAWESFSRGLRTTPVLCEEVKDVVCPAFADSISEGDVRWEKQVGDTVAEDDVICEIETDKTSVPVPSPAAGVILELLVEDGATVSPGTKLVKLKLGAGGAPAAKPAAAPAAEAPAAPPTPAAAPPPPPPPPPPAAAAGPIPTTPPPPPPMPAAPMKVRSSKVQLLIIYIRAACIILCISDHAAASTAATPASCGCGARGEAAARGPDLRHRGHQVRAPGQDEQDEAEDRQQAEGGSEHQRHVDNFQ